MLNNYDEIRAASSFQLKLLRIGLGLLLVVAPLGLLATGTAWGEWGTEDIVNKIGYVPEGMSNLAGRWKGILPDYAFPKDEKAADQEGKKGETSGNAAEGAKISDTNADTQTGVAEYEGPVTLDGIWESTPGYLV